MTRGIANDLSGKRFGHLKVIERATNDKSNNAQWLCRCDCKEKAIIRAAFLIKGQMVCSKSCPLNPARQIKDIANKKFGSLIAIKHIGFNAQRKSVWIFRCACGIRIKVPSDRVLNSGMKTCGKGIHASSYKHGLSGTRGYKSMHFMKYMAKKKSQTPLWITKRDIKTMIQLYLKAENLTKETKVPHEVDHYYPLQGKKVCGLHVPLNLRIITRADNRKKLNKHPDDVC